MYSWFDVQHTHQKSTGIYKLVCSCTKVFLPKENQNSKPEQITSSSFTKSSVSPPRLSPATEKAAKPKSFFIKLMNKFTFHRDLQLLVPGVLGTHDNHNPFIHFFNSPLSTTIKLKFGILLPTLPLILYYAYVLCPLFSYGLPLWLIIWPQLKVYLFI